MNKGKFSFFKSWKGIVTCAVVVFLIVVILLIFNIDTLKAVFTGGKGGGNDDNSQGGAIPDIDSGSIMPGTDIFYENDPTNIFSAVNVRDSYTWVFRVTTSYNGVRGVNAFTMTKSGDNFKVESAAKDMIYNNGSLYIESDVYSFNTTADASQIYDEIGITSLESVIERAKDGKATVTVSNDGKTVSVIVTDSESTIQSEFEVSVEFGIVLSETHYLNGQMIRSVSTDSVDVLIGDDVDEDCFKIPAQQ